MTMMTKTETVGTYSGLERILVMEQDGWQVRHIVPVMESDVLSTAEGPRVPTFTTKLWITFERERESGWVVAGKTPV